LLEGKTVDRKVSKIKNLTDVKKSNSSNFNKSYFDITLVGCYWDEDYSVIIILNKLNTKNLDKIEFKKN